MACNFKVVFPGIAEEHIGKAKAAITKYGGSFKEDGNGGTFEINIGIGKIAGSFMLNGPEVEFNITHKPFIITCSRIEKEIRKYAGLGD